MGRDSGIDGGRRRERVWDSLEFLTVCNRRDECATLYRIPSGSHGTDFASEGNTGVMCTGTVQSSPVHSDPDLPSGSGGGCGDRSQSCRNRL